MKTNVLMVLLAGTLLVASCAGSGSGEKSDYATQMLDSAKADTTSPKLVKTADMKLKVPNVPKAAEAIAQLTVAYDGSVVHNNINSEMVNQQDITVSTDSIKRLTVYNIVGEMTIKIPSDSIEVFMDKMAQAGIFIDNRKMDVEDRTLDYLSQELKARNREKSARLRKRIKLTQRGADSILQLNDDAVDRRISNLRTRQDVKYSTLNLALYQSQTVHTEMVANTDLSGYNNSLSTKSGMALSKGWVFFTDVITALLHLWPFILLSLGIWMGYRYYKKRTENAIQPAEQIKN